MELVQSLNTSCLSLHGTLHQLEYVSLIGMDLFANAVASQYLKRRGALEVIENRLTAKKYMKHAIEEYPSSSIDVSSFRCWNCYQDSLEHADCLFQARSTYGIQGTGGQYCRCLQAND
ncbi:hypothetical protein L6164_018732 [Bauhinia variegata]|uniref:Uncharacterized protein n=1 Tax=Bauhinia variegata TaxID=167791 RepID=A0ACB9NBY4_BAUVA|nr:hypothetical protein L6164_018732 [Bauhinia variegata]